MPPLGQQSSVKQENTLPYSLQTLAIGSIQLIENKKVLLDTQVVINNWKAQDPFHPSLPSAKLNILVPFLSVTINDDMLLLIEMLTILNKYSSFMAHHKMSMDETFNQKMNFFSSETQSNHSFELTDLEII